jgi:protein tyrosine/serine phosphatase
MKVSVLIIVVAGLTPIGIDGFKDLRDSFVPKRFGVVAAGKIYRSGQLHRALVRETLTHNHIQVVIDLTHDDPHNINQQAEQTAIRELGLQGLRFPMNGNGTGEIEQVAKAVAALAAAEHDGKPALVHCAAGAQRTGCVVATYRLLVKQDSPTDVLTEMEQYGWRPDHDQVMLNFLNDHLPDFAARLVQLGTLSEMPPSIPVLAATSKTANTSQVATATSKTLK